MTQFQSECNIPNGRQQAMAFSSLAGNPAETSQRGELDYWQHNSQSWNLKMQYYRQVFPFESIDYTREILDIGSGPRSVFEDVAPQHAKVIPSDTLADEYNLLVPDKRFRVIANIPDRRFGLITMFNMIDHMNKPDELLAQVAQHLEGRGELWLYVHLDRPFDANLHPQCFRFWEVAPLMQKFFTIKTCGLCNEVPFVNVNGFWCICTAKGKDRPSAWWSAKIGILYSRNFLRRALLAIKRRLIQRSKQGAVGSHR